MDRTTIAIAIGINKYNNYQTLSCCANDAIAFMGSLKNKTKLSQSHLLTTEQDSDCNPTSVAVSGLLTEISRMELKKDDVIFFYFAGHGFSTNGRDYFVCTDTMPDNLETAISTDDVISALRMSKAGTAVLAVDACRLIISRTTYNFGERMLEYARRQGTVVLFGCSPGEVCQELPNLGEGHGIFTYSLINAISQLEYITPLFLDREIMDSVRNICKQHNLMSQRPYTVVAPLQKAEYDLFKGIMLPSTTRGNKKCILIVGPCFAGKTTLGQYLASEYGYVHVEMSSFTWQRFMKRSPDFKGSLQDFIEEEIWRSGQYDVIAQDLLAAHGGLDRLVICGARRPEEIETIRSQNWDVYPIYLFSSDSQRFIRHQNTQSVSEYDLAYSDFVKRDLREYSWGLAKVGTMRGFEFLENERTIEDLTNTSKSILQL